MIASAKANALLSPEQIGYAAFQESGAGDGQGAHATVPPTYYLRGNPGPQATGSFLAAATSGTTVPLTLTRTQGANLLPEFMQLVVINHADAPVSFIVQQQIADFVVGTGTILSTLYDSTTNVASNSAEIVLLQFPWTSEGILIVTLTAASTMTNGGAVGAQLRYE